MNPRLVAAALGLALLVGALGALSMGESCGKGKVDRAEQKADVAHGEANAHGSAAITTDAEVLRLKEAHKTDQANVDSARAEVQRLRKILASRPVPVPDPPSPDPAPVPVVSASDLHGIVDAQDALIKAQDQQIIGLKTEVQFLTLARDEWKATAEARNREAVGLRIALDAQKHVATSWKWMGRIQGFACGVAVGFVGGKL